MIRYIFLSFLLFLFQSLQLKSQIVAPPRDTIKAYNKVLIVPFEQNRYLCGIQKNFAESSNKSHTEIVNYFRYGLISEIQNEFLYHHRTLSLLHNADSIKDLYKTYSSISYAFTPLPEPEEDQKQKGKKIKNEKYTKIEDGQVKSKREIIPKFAKVVLIKPEILGYLNQKYGADIFLFVTELDIENDISDPIAFINNEYLRFIKVHYCLIDNKGDFLSEGVVKVNFPNNLNDIYILKKEYFPVLARLLAKELPPSTRKNSADKY
jgi:hypothetical protein